MEYFTSPQSPESGSVACKNTRYTSVLKHRHIHTHPKLHTELQDHSFFTVKHEFKLLTVTETTVEPPGEFSGILAM